MSARSIFVTWPMEAEVRAILERVGTVRTSHTEHELPVAELARHVADVEAIIPMGAHPIPEPVLAAAPRLRIVAVAAVGYNIVDVAAATRRGILVTNTPGVLTDTTADMAWALMLGVARRVPESDRFVRAGKWTGVYWSQLMGADVHGTTLGVIGLGRIGQAIARRAQGFGMRVLYHKRTPDPETERRVGAEYRAKADLLREADFVVLSIPLTAETRHLIGAAELALMKPTAFLVNVARGPVVDEAALVEALRIEAHRRGRPRRLRGGAEAPPGPPRAREPRAHAPHRLGVRRDAAPDGDARRGELRRRARGAPAAEPGQPGGVAPGVKRGKLWLFLLDSAARRRRLPDSGASASRRSASRSSPRSPRSASRPARSRWSWTPRPPTWRRSTCAWSSRARPRPVLSEDLSAGATRSLRKPVTLDAAALKLQEGPGGAGDRGPRHALAPSARRAALAWSTASPSTSPRRSSSSRRPRATSSTPAPAS